MRNNKHLWILLLLFAGLSLLVVTTLNQYEDQVAKSAIKDLEVTISRYALQCYATEGAYPPDIDYLVDNYGLVLNTDKYIYEYESIAENIRPSIRVHAQFKSRRSDE